MLLGLDLQELLALAALAVVVAELLVQIFQAELQLQAKEVMVELA